MVYRMLSAISEVQSDLYYGIKLIPAQSSTIRKAPIYRSPSGKLEASCRKCKGSRAQIQATGGDLLPPPSSLQRCAPFSH